MVWDWSLDEQALLLSSRGELNNIYLFNRITKTQRVVVQSSEYSMFQARLSPDQRWVTFMGARPPNGRLWIAPFRGHQAVAESDWIPLTEATGWGDKPRWSPDGNTVYYVAERDGFPCVWAQRLEPVTKRPIGPPASIHHFHSGRLSMRNVGYGGLEIGIAQDGIIFNLGELTGNIWQARSH
jgi:Tol biopolymer transport system component